jgi:outer membrane protein assembly factor BamA
MNLFYQIKYFLNTTIFILLFGNIILLAVEPDSLLIRNDEIVKIDSVRIEGNETTKDFIIMRELTFHTGDSVSGKTLRFNRERVFSLRLFNQVEFKLEKAADINILVIQLTESWYLYPLPLFRLRDGDFKKSTYGINLSYRNFRGRNESLRAAIGFGYDPFYTFNFENPAISFNDGIGLSFAFAYVNSTNKSENAKAIIGEDFTNKMFFQSISISKRFNQFNIGFFTIGFNYIETPYTRSGITASGNNIDRVPFAGLSYIYDSRDLKQFSETGLFTFASFTHFGFSINDISYNQFSIDFREYRKLIDDIAAKWRVKYKTAFGNVVPYYDYAYLGYFDNVRGHLHDLREGKSFILTSLELSHPIVREWNFHVKLPFLPEKLTSARIAIHLTSFFDTGDAFDRNDKLAIKNFYYGYGFGITILFLPYNAIRFEYAVNENGKGEFVIGSGFSF